MSEPISIKKFAWFISLYGFVSLVIHFATAFTIPGFLIYLITLLPFYLLCIVHVISLGQKHRYSTVQYFKGLLYPIAIFQLLVILSSPSNCYEVKQENACSSFLQVLFIESNLNDFSAISTPWSGLELLFPIALALYGILILMFLGTVKIKPISP